MVGVQIEEAAKRIGASVEIVDSAVDAKARLDSGEVDLIVVDLAAKGFDVEGLALAAREASTRVVGFYPHVDAGLKRRAQAAGIERVYARSRFLPQIARSLQESMAGQ